MEEILKLKQCNRCNLTKEIKCFSKHPETKDGYFNQCRNCRNESTSKYQTTLKGKKVKKKSFNKYYLKNKEKFREKFNNRYNETILKLKIDRGGKCEICGYNKFIKILQFHHLRDKTFEISSKNKHKPYIELYNESLKCQLLCPNCHAEITLNNKNSC
jgi:hypothetical protein